MAELTIQTVQTPNRTNKNTALMAGTGAVVGAASRYVLPTKKELASFVNKENVDTFVKTTANSARAANRSILKYGAVGAIIATGVNALAKVFNLQKDENKNNTYSKYDAILDASDYACMVTWYED